MLNFQPERLPKKILHIIESLAIGGAEKLLLGMINGMSNYEHHLIILGEPETLRSSISADCAFLNLGIKNRPDFIRAVGKVKKYIRENNIDIVHAHLYKANILSRLATPRKVLLFNSIHAISSLAAYHGSRMTLIIERLSYRKRHHIIAVSQEVLKDFKNYVGLKGPSTVLYNFIDEKFFAPQPRAEFSKDKLQLVAVGNLRHQKNYPYLIEAFKKISPSVSLDIYGEGLMQAELKKQINEHKLNIRLCGLQKDMHTILPRYDAFVMSSFFEGQPLSLLEAMACGLPVLLADIPVLREVTGNDALYFDINDPMSFGCKIQQVLEGKVDLKRMAAASHKRVNEFAHRDQYFEKLNALYSRL